MLQPQGRTFAFGRKDIKVKLDYRISRSAVSALALSVFCLPAHAQDGLSGWNWGFEIYGWLPEIEMTTDSGTEIELSLSDILDNLEFTLQGGVFATKGNWKIFADAVYMSLNLSDNATAQVGPIDIDFEAEIDNKAFISTFGGGYKVHETPATTLYAIGGLRYTYMDVEVEGSLGPNDFAFDGDGSNLDAIIGLQGETKINDDWSFHYYGDVGTGESDYTVQAKVGFTYAFESFDLDLSYRYLDYDLGSNDALDDLKVWGPQIGVRFEF